MKPTAPHALITANGSRRVFRRTAMLAWSTWVVLLLILALSFALQWLSRDVPAQDVTSLRGFDGLLGMVAASAGLPIAARRPEHPIGWLFLALGASWLLPNLALQYAYLALLGPAVPLPGGAVAAWAQDVTTLTLSAPLFAFVLLLFPTGRLLSRRWRLVAAFAIASGAMEGLGGALRPGPIWRFRILDNPYGASGALQDVAAIVAVTGNVLFNVAIFSGVIGLIIRFRRSRGDERQQLKWIATAAAIVGTGMIGFVAIGQDTSTSPWAKPVFIYLFAAITAVPVAASIAVLRYRLYDIDRIITRTVSYAVVTGLLAATYSGFVFVIGIVVRPIGAGGDLTVASSVLASAALFRPVRGRVQAAIDKRFNRARYDAAQTIDAFSARLREEIDLDTLRSELQGVVERTMQPASVHLWLRGARPVTVSGRR